MLTYSKKPATKKNEAYSDSRPASWGNMPFAASLPNSVMLSMMGMDDNHRNNAPLQNQTGLPDAMKARFEKKFGLPLDDVKVRPHRACQTGPGQTRDYLRQEVL